MPPTTVELTKPDAPTPDQFLKYLYVLYYKDQQSNKLIKTFYHPTDLDGAQQRARQHCLKMQYRFIRVESLMADLDAEEMAKVPAPAPALKSA